MPFGWADAEPLLKSLKPLCGQGDFGQQNQYGLICCEGGRDGFKINFRLAGPGNAVQQGHRECIGLYRLTQGNGGLRLIR